MVGEQHKCPACDGTGYRDSCRCRACDGTGVLQVHTYTGSVQGLALELDADRETI